MDPETDEPYEPHGPQRGAESQERDPDEPQADGAEPASPRGAARGRGSSDQNQPANGADDARQRALVFGTKAVAVSSNKPLSSKFRGVCWNKKNKRWQAAINSSGKYLYLGSYDTEAEAAGVFDKAAVRIRGAKARLNFAYSDYVDGEGRVLVDPVIDELLQQATNPDRPKRQRGNVSSITGGYTLATAIRAGNTHGVNVKEGVAQAAALAAAVANARDEPALAAAQVAAGIVSQQADGAGGPDAGAAGEAGNGAAAGPPARGGRRRGGGGGGDSDSDWSEHGEDARPRKRRPPPRPKDGPAAGGARKAAPAGGPVAAAEAEPAPPPVKLELEGRAGAAGQLPGVAPDSQLGALMAAAGLGGAPHPHPLPFAHGGTNGGGLALPGRLGPLDGLGAELRELAGGRGLGAGGRGGGPGPELELDPRGPRLGALQQADPLLALDPRGRLGEPLGGVGLSGLPGDLRGLRADARVPGASLAALPPLRPGRGGGAGGLGGLRGPAGGDEDALAALQQLGAVGGRGGPGADLMQLLAGAGAGPGAGAEHGWAAARHDGLGPAPRSPCGREASLLRAELGLGLDPGGGRAAGGRDGELLPLDHVDHLGRLGGVRQLLRPEEAYGGRGGAGAAGGLPTARAELLDRELERELEALSRGAGRPGEGRAGAGALGGALDVRGAFLGPGDGVAGELAALLGLPQGAGWGGRAGGGRGGEELLPPRPAVDQRAQLRELEALHAARHAAQVRELEALRAARAEEDEALLLRQLLHHRHAQREQDALLEELRHQLQPQGAWGALGPGGHGGAAVSPRAGAGWDAGPGGLGGGGGAWRGAGGAGPGPGELYPDDKAALLLQLARGRHPEQRPPDPGDSGPSAVQQQQQQQQQHRPCRSTGDVWHGGEELPAGPDRGGARDGGRQGGGEEACGAEAEAGVRRALPAGAVLVAVLRSAVPSVVGALFEDPGAGAPPGGEEGAPQPQLHAGVWNGRVHKLRRLGGFASREAAEAACRAALAILEDLEPPGGQQQQQPLQQPYEPRGTSGAGALGGGLGGEGRGVRPSAYQLLLGVSTAAAAEVMRGGGEQHSSGSQGARGGGGGGRLHGAAANPLGLLSATAAAVTYPDPDDPGAGGGGRRARDAERDEATDESVATERQPGAGSAGRTAGGSGGVGGARSGGSNRGPGSARGGGGGGSGGDGSGGGRAGGLSGAANVGAMLSLGGGGGGGGGAQPARSNMSGGFSGLSNGSLHLALALSGLSGSRGGGELDAAGLLLGGQGSELGELEALGSLGLSLRPSRSGQQQGSLRGRQLAGEADYEADGGAGGLAGGRGRGRGGGGSDGGSFSALRQLADMDVQEALQLFLSQRQQQPAPGARRPPPHEQGGMRGGGGW